MFLSQRHLKNENNTKGNSFRILAIAELPPKYSRGTFISFLRDRGIFQIFAGICLLREQHQAWPVRATPILGGFYEQTFPHRHRACSDRRRSSYSFRAEACSVADFQSREVLWNRQIRQKRLRLHWKQLVRRHIEGQRRSQGLDLRS